MDFQPTCGTCVKSCTDSPQPQPKPLPKPPTKLLEHKIPEYIVESNKYTITLKRTWTLKQLIDSSIEREVLPFVELFLLLLQRPEWKDYQMEVVHFQYRPTNYEWLTVRELQHPTERKDIEYMLDWTGWTLLRNQDEWMRRAHVAGKDWPERIKKALIALME